ncbi:Ca(2+)-dependent cysteine protease [Mortierella sp. GBA30]|nr:Ca(2+)-dependent cysteine protease [Mortierella sp. GBA30]
MSSFGNDEIDPAILADVTRVVQELMRLQQEEQPGYAQDLGNKDQAHRLHDPMDGVSVVSREFVDENPCDSAEIQELKVPQLELEWEQEDTIDGIAIEEGIKNQLSLLLSSSTSSALPCSPSSSSASLSHSTASYDTVPTISSPTISPSKTVLLPTGQLEGPTFSQTENNEPSLLAPSSNEVLTNGSGSDQVLISLLPGQKTPTRATASNNALTTFPDKPDHAYFEHGPDSSAKDLGDTTSQKSEDAATTAAVVPRPVLTPPIRPRRKKALLVGINYFGDPNQLLGCINDTRDVFGFLNGYYGFRYQDTIMLTDDQIYEDKRPTGANIRYWMKWLVKDAQPQDSLFFHYAGHGGRIKDFSYNGKSEHLGDEADGYDEIIYPCDYLRCGIISDDEMYDILVKELPAGVQLTALVDACHSGTMLDLPYVYNGNHVTALEAVTRTKVGAMAAMSSGDFDPQGTNNNTQTQTTTTTTTTTTTVTTTMTNGGAASPIVSQFMNGFAKTTDGYLEPPGGVPPIHIKEGGSPLMGPGKTHSNRSVHSNDDEDEEIPDIQLNEANDALEAGENSKEALVPQLAITSPDAQRSDETLELAPSKTAELEDRSIEREAQAWHEPGVLTATDNGNAGTLQSIATSVEDAGEDDEDEDGMKEARRLALFRATKGNVIMFSGCRDDQASADIRASEKDAAIIANHHKYGEAAEGAIATTNWGAPTTNGVPEDETASNPLGYSLPQPYKSPMARGAVTYAWIQCLSQKREQTYEELLKSMRYFMQQRDLEQIPQLGSGMPMDMRTVFVL